LETPILPPNDDLPDRGDLRVALGIGGVWVLLALVIGPGGEFALNDDWAYNLPVKALVERGSIRFTDWNTASLIGQVVWAALFCLPRGYSITAVRLSTLTLGLIGVLGLYALLRSHGAGRRVAALGALVLLANPIYLELSYTFMTDVPFVAVMIPAVLFLSRGIERESDRDVWLGLGLAFAALFIRQVALAIFLGFTAAYPLRRGLGGRWFIQAVLPTVVAFAALKGYERGLAAIEQLPAGYSKFNDGLMEALSGLARLEPKALRLPVERMVALATYLGLFTIPFTILLWGSRTAGLPRRGKWAQVLLLGGLTVAIAAATRAFGHKFPSLPNIIYDFALGPRDLHRDWSPTAPVTLWRVVRFVAALGTALSLMALAILVRTALRRIAALGTREHLWRPMFLALVGAIYSAPILISYHEAYDRYTLGLLPLLLVLIWEGLGAGKSGLGLDAGPHPRSGPTAVCTAVAPLAIALAFGVAGTHDYLEWHRAAWTADLSLLRDEGVSLEEIDGGWEFNNYMINERRLYLSRAEREAGKSNEERTKGLGTLVRPDSRYRLAFTPLAEHEVLRRIPLTPWLPFTFRELLLLRRTGPATRGGPVPVHRRHHRVMRVGGSRAPPCVPVPQTRHVARRKGFWRSLIGNGRHRL